jgi:hypothetical protein
VPDVGPPGEYRVATLFAGRSLLAQREDRRRRDANRAEQKPGPVAIRPATYGHPGAWKAFSKAGFCCPPWLTDVG